jgi:hypothetical protein
VCAPADVAKPGALLVSRPQDVSTKLRLQAEEHDKVHKVNLQLTEENSLLKQQVEATGRLLDALKQDQEQRISGIADKLKEQVSCGLCS